MLLHKLVVIAPSIKALLVLLLVVAHCSLASKLLLKAGALLTLKKGKKLRYKQRLLRQPFLLMKIESRQEFYTLRSSTMLGYLDCGMCDIKFSEQSFLYRPNEIIIKPICRYYQVCH